MSQKAAMMNLNAAGRMGSSGASSPGWADRKGRYIHVAGSITNLFVTKTRCCRPRSHCTIGSATRPLSHFCFPNRSLRPHGVSFAACPSTYSAPSRVQCTCIYQFADQVNKSPIHTQHINYIINSNKTTVRTHRVQSLLLQKKQVTRSLLVQAPNRPQAKPSNKRGTMKQNY